MINASHNLLYAEFTDCRDDWNFTGEPRALELFDLAADPWQMSNLLAGAAAPPADLASRVRELASCHGASCN